MLFLFCNICWNYIEHISIIGNISYSKTGTFDTVQRISFWFTYIKKIAYYFNKIKVNSESLLLRQTALKFGKLYRIYNSVTSNMI